MNNKEYFVELELYCLKKEFSLYFIFLNIFKNYINYFNNKKNYVFIPIFMNIFSFQLTDTLIIFCGSISVICTHSFF